MNKQQTINLINQVTEQNLQRVISDWVEAIHDFHQWNSKLVNVIDEYNYTEKFMINYLLKLGNRWTITDLIQLRVDVTNSLDKLLRDIDCMDEKTDISLKIEQLIAHTKTIRHWNERIRNALEIRTFGRLDS